MKQNNSVQPSEDTNIRLHVTQEEKKVFLLWLYDNYLIDASHVKVHPDAAGARGGNQAMGRTKGGSTPRYIWPWMRMVCRCDSLSVLVPQRIAQLQRN